MSRVTKAQRRSNNGAVTPASLSRALRLFLKHDAWWRIITSRACARGLDRSAVLISVSGSRNGHFYSYTIEHPSIYKNPTWYQRQLVITVEGRSSNATALLPHLPPPPTWGPTLGELRALAGLEARQTHVQVPPGRSLGGVQLTAGTVLVLNLLRGRKHVWIPEGWPRSGP